MGFQKKTLNAHFVLPHNEKKSESALVINVTVFSFSSQKVEDKGLFVGLFQTRSRVMPVDKHKTKKCAVLQFGVINKAFQQ